MATTRQRQRELERRRHERRTQRIQQQRARAKRRNTVLGAVLATAAVLAGLGFLIYHLSGGSGKSTASVKPASSTSPEPVPSMSALTDLTKPKITVPKGPPPAKLTSKDLRVGTGAVAKTGDTVEVQYVGVNYADGKQFDASYDRGQPFSFTLGKAQVIKGWDQGVVGMKVGGMRQLIIPPSLGYGPAGSPPTIKPNETLIFDVELVTVKK